MSNKHNFIRLRRGTAAEWAASEPQPGGEVLKLGEPGYEKDTKKLKIGDGITPWNSLPYIGGDDIIINPEDIQDIIGDGFLISGSGINISYNDSLNSLTISTSGVSFVGHTHVSNDITDFNSSVSGLLPTINNNGDNRLLTSTGSSTGINAESNITFDGNKLNVIGSISVDNLNFDNNTISSSSGNIIISPSGDGALQRDSGGDSRGVYAVDWQGTRFINTQVASGPYSTIGGGSINTSSGAYSTVGGGRFNTSSSNHSTVGGGSINTSSGNSSTVGGGSFNVSSGNSSTVGGGSFNTSSGHYSIVGGGRFNTSSSNSSTIGGGSFNTSSNTYSTVGGGRSNTSSGYRSTVGGGAYNTSSNDSSTVGGGSSNTASSFSSTVGGGQYNTSSNESSTVGGGSSNTASGFSSTVGGGQYNTSSGFRSTIGGGQDNICNNNSSTVGGGRSNTASGFSSTIGGGQYNTSSGFRSTISGGKNNTASGSYSTISGGGNNTASGSYSTSGGIDAIADRYGMQAYAAGNFSTNGDAQRVDFVLRNITTNNTSTTLFLNGNTGRLTIPSNKALFATINIAGIINGGSKAAHYVRKVAIKNVGGTTSLIGTVSPLGSDVEDDALYDVTITADNTNDALQINVTGKTGETIRWVAHVEGVEIAYG